METIEAIARRQSELPNPSDAELPNPSDPDPSDPETYTCHGDGDGDDGDDINFTEAAVQSEE